MWFDIKKKKKKIEIRVCCFNCVNYKIYLINDGGIENRILIDCNRTDLRDNYPIPFTDDYVTDTDSDFIAKFEEVDGLYSKNCISLFVLLNWRLISFRTHVYVWIVERFLSFLSWRNYML